MLGETRLREEVEALKTSEPIVVRLLQGQPPVVIPPYTAEMQACDKKIAEIFGGKGAVAAANGFEPEGMTGKSLQFRGNLGDPKDDSHLDRRLHLYGNKEGTKFTDLYIPGGAVYIGKNTATDEDSFLFYYKKLFKVNDVTLVASHVAKFIYPKIGTEFVNRTLIGEIGGKGGTSKEKDGSLSYIHSHLAICKGRGVNKNLIPFPLVFC